MRMTQNPRGFSGAPVQNSWQPPSTFSCEPLEDRTLLSGTTTFRPPSVPLVTVDPYLSIWSDATNLTDDVTRHWTGVPNALVSLIRIDGVSYRLMGDDPSSMPAMPQVNLQVLPTETIYDFDNGHVHVTLTFLTPKVPSDLNLFALPLTYLNWSVSSVDGQSHSVQIYDSTSSELAVNTTDQVVQWSRQTSGAVTALNVGTTAQTIFSPAGDEVRIDWGYAYASANTALSTSSIGGDESLIAAFQSTGILSNTDDTTGPRAVDDNEPVMAFAFDLGAVGSQVVSRHLEVAYDEIYSIDYYGEPLLPYWNRTGVTAVAMLASADSAYNSTLATCSAFDQQLMADLTTEGGTQYADLTALAYRQSLAACGLAADSNGQPLLFTKENSSNGDISTVDVIYPMSPILLLLSPGLMKAALTPVLDYASSPQWTFENAPHDLGTYPLVTGRPDGGEAMPVEESANMLIMLDGLAKAENSPEFAYKYWTQVTQWANFLLPYAYDPGDQLTTDDFLGTIDHSTNLAVKAIEGLGAYAQLAQMLGETSVASSFTAAAQSDVTHWISVSSDGNHFDMAYNDPGTWSELYNLVWDKILGINLFPSYVASEEIAYYESIMQTYGVPVESTTTTAKTDWQFWSASLASNNTDFQTLIAPIYNFMNTTTNRVPLQDSYDVTNIASSGFTARPVVGGLFIKMLTDSAMWEKYASAGVNFSGPWAALPQSQTVIPTSQTTPQTWQYTTTTPASNWMDNSFDDSSWSTGSGAFGTSGTPGISPNTTWNTSDIWLRRTFTMPTETFNNLKFLLYHDEDVEVYVNGVLAYSAPSYITSYLVVNINPAALALLTPGATINLAVHCHQTTGGQGVDVGLVDLEQYNPVIPTSQDSPQTWKYTLNFPVGNWTSTGYDDSSWTTAGGAFGTSGTPGITPNTTWNSDQIFLRRTFTIPAGTITGNLYFDLYHDENVEVYLNGVLAYSATGYITSYQIASINSSALALLTPGATITMAVYCRQTTGGQGVDVGIVSLVPPATETQTAGISPGSGAQYSITGSPGAQVLDVTAGTITITSDLSTEMPNYTLQIENGATVILESNQHLGALNILGNGRLDVGTYSMWINYGSNTDPIASIIAAIHTGYAAGAWSGAGIMSSAAAANSNSYGLGYADSADVGNPAALPSGTIEIMYTLLGDANLDGKVNGTDFTIMSAHFNQSGASWDQGDFNYDGVVNSADFVELSENFNQAVSPVASVSVASAAAVSTTGNSTSTTSAAAAVSPANSNNTTTSPPRRRGHHAHKN